MEPSQFLITLLLTGAVGSVFGISAFFFVLCLCVKCPECGTRGSRRAKHCQQCGEPLKKLPGTRQESSVRKPSASQRMTEDYLLVSTPVDSLYRMICGLRPEQRESLNRRLREMPRPQIDH